MSKQYQQSEFSKARVAAIKADILAGKRPFAPLDTGSARAELERLATPFPITAGEVREGLDQITGPTRLEALRGQLEAEELSPALVNLNVELEVQRVEREIIAANPGLNLQGQPARVRAAALAVLNRPVS